MDYFYAQVEERENPALKTKPIGVGGTSSRRGILCTSNYIARRYGVKSAMPTFKALDLCPDLVLIKPNFKLYKKASDEVFKIFHEYTDMVEGISLDEAYLDVTDVDKCHNSATLIAKEIKEKIYKRTGLTASAGVSYNKLLSKIASEYNKPNALLTITPEHAPDFIKTLPVNSINGVGKKTNEKMKSLGLYTFEDLQRKSLHELEHHFGSYGLSLKNYAQGIDHREVKKERERKSLSCERTLFENLDNSIQMNSHIIDIHEEMVRRLKSYSHRQIKSIFVKLKFSDFTQTTIETQSYDFDIEKYLKLMNERYSEHLRPIRLIGVGVKFHRDTQFSRQLYLPCCA